MDLNDLIAVVKAQLSSAADPKIKEWWDRYLRQTIEFRGTKMADTRRGVRAVLEAEGLDGAAPMTKELGFALLGETMAEDKLAGILILAEWVLPAGDLNCSSDLDRLGDQFDAGHIGDWNTCDWLCVKVLGPMVAARGAPCARAIAGWATDPGLWRSRAGVVSFVNLLTDASEPIPGLHEIVLDACAVNVRRTERFAQTGVGWTIRELSRAAPDLAAAFVAGNLGFMSREAIRAATAKLPPGVRTDLLARHAGRVNRR
jgi:3-methyladenine DNA glycosylase AlkD